jgi:hypothetical protein
MDDPFFIRAENKFYEKHISPKVVRVLKQTGRKPNLIVDRYKRAMKPGKRISKTGKIYFESRRNRSDVNPEKRL